MFVVIVAVTGTAIGLYFALRPTPVIGARIQLNQRYYLTDIRSGFFRYPDENGMPSDDIIHMIRYDQSYGIFENDFQTFRLVFAHGTYRTEFNFIVTRFRHTRTGTTATLRNVFNGELREYTIRTTPTQIKFSSTIVSHVTVASREFAPAPTVEIFRDNVYVLIFAVTTPPHIIEREEQE